MNLSEWINKVGVAKAAEVTGVSKATVYQWINLDAAPRIETSFKIINYTGNAIDFNSIYQPFAEKKYVDHGRKSDHFEI